MFGKTPSGERMNRMINSPNFKNGKFKNLSHTPDLTEGVSYYAVLKEFIFFKSKREKPGQKQYGPFDFAILECGQYNKSWKYIQMMPEEIIAAAGDLKATTLLPVHWGKFSLANHVWDNPIKAVVAIAQIKNQQLVSPMIGETVQLKGNNEFESWWEKIS